MSEFNIKQQNRNRFKASKEKKQAARFKQTEKLVRNQQFERQSNASESSEGVEVLIEKKSRSKSEKRKQRERERDQKKADSNESESVAKRELDNPSPCSSKSLEWNHQSTKENKPTVCQNLQKEKPQKAASGFQHKKQFEPPDQFPRPFKKVKVKQNESKITMFGSVSPVPKLQKTSFQWFNPSAIHSGSDEGKNANEPSKNHKTKKSNESLTNKASGQQKVYSQKGSNSQQSAPFTTAGLNQNELKTVRGLFTEPSTSKSIDSDLSNKYDCSNSGRPESSHQGNRNSFSDFKCQPTVLEKSKEESSEDGSRNSKKYRKRAIKSHANRNYDLPTYGNANEEDEEGEGFDDLSKATFSVSSHFLMKEQKEWLEQSESCVNPLAWNLKCLAAALNTIPFHQRQSLPDNIFTPDEITRLTSEADSKIQIYEEARHEAEEEGKMKVFKEADDNILKDDFISDFLTCGDSFSAEKSVTIEANEGGFIIPKARNSYILNLDLDEDDFVSTHTIESKIDTRKKKNKLIQPKNQGKTGKTMEFKHGESLKSECDERGLLNSSSEEESRKPNDQKFKLKKDTSGSPATKMSYSGSGKIGEQISSKQVGDKSNSSKKITEKRPHLIVSTSSSPPKTTDRVVEDVLGNGDFISDLLQSPSQSTEKTTRVRGSSAFNITESLSDLLAEKSASSVNSNPNGSLNMKSPSYETSVKSSPVPIPNKMENLETDLKKMNFGSPSNMKSPSCETSVKSSPVLTPNKMENLETDLKRLNFGSPSNFKFDFKMGSSTTSTLTASNPVELKKFSPSPPKKAVESRDFYSRYCSKSKPHPTDPIKTQIFTSSLPKTSFEMKNESPTKAKLVCKFDFRKIEEEKKRTEEEKKRTEEEKKRTEEEKKKTKKSSGSKSLTREGASSVASESSSSGSGKAVIDDEIDILLGITSQTPNEKTASEQTSKGQLQSVKKEIQQDATDSKNTSTSMLDEDLDDWLDSVLQS
ncbi:hypothetical protein LSTR_LSTR003431 [Laodelphax striatellus]|uniref:Uncharacterized protein n=1 Tax=Laodelphax striatellus TaxID=195883 RepID=A0A482X312_LAOST|nr:hypothetical protein LSTR_LSTR003431 [Laodelphax striatellus]